MLILIINTWSYDKYVTLTACISLRSWKGICSRPNVTFRLDIPFATFQVAGVGRDWYSIKYIVWYFTDE